MRILSNSALEIEYPDNQVFSGDLNRIVITKVTTATHVELSFVLGGYTYNENLYFLSNSITFSMSEILELLFNRDQYSLFDTTQPFNFTIKIYNNTTLIDTENLSIDTVILGKRRVFDELGKVKNLSTYDYDYDLNMLSIYYYFSNQSELYAKLIDGSSVFVDSYNGISIISVDDIPGPIKHLYYDINILNNPTFQYLGGYGTNSWSEDEYIGCGSSLKITALNKLQLVIPDVSCQDTFTVQYLDGNFTQGNVYKVSITIDSVTNPSGNSQYVQINLGGNLGAQHSGTGTFTDTIVCGASETLELIFYMDADTAGFGSHAMSAISISLSEEEGKIYINESCEGSGKKIALRFLNRYGFWRHYYVIKRTETISSTKGINLWQLENNITELNNIYAEQKIGSGQAINVYRDGLTKELINDFSDIIYSEYKHIFDDVNGIWTPIRLATNTFNISEKESLFEVSLNLILQSNE